MKITKLVRTEIARAQAGKLYEMMGAHGKYMSDDLETALRKEAQDLISEAVKLEREIKDNLCKNCWQAEFEHGTDCTERGWYCYMNKWDNRGKTKNPVHFPTEEGLPSVCEFFDSIFYE